MITVSRLSKTFHLHRKEPGLWGSMKSLVARRTIEKRAVNEVSFSVGEGEIVGLLGANGAGKTTVVKMLAGIIHPSSGEASVLGYKPWERDNRLRRQIALIMGQKAQLWWDLPAADCFLLLREIYRIDRKRYEENLERLSAVLGVRDLLTTQVRRLSLGERMKMELIAALLHDPRVVYLDEPTIGLDISAQRSIREFVQSYQREHRPAVILTSHYMADIEHLCRRIIILREGGIVFDGQLKDVVDRFASTKIVAVRLQEGATTAPDTGGLDKLGEVIACSREEVRLHVPRAEVAAASAHLMSTLPVIDLSIEEEDVGTIIENIMTKPGGES